ncbi:hypothetical protein AXG93_2446s1260 [Marchantia polymorpha subsp. ruderalis]|uniref:Uncharacterized protein n=1 Tax=Marchantia polymorpha subsp. ruderalis TaxID=1480154 RepID=A0A176W716_MARPO|nr:hypothetical protein AXG93_2446s1260 [Marchantia polymorpha subsp. ruderalis]
MDLGLSILYSTSRAIMYGVGNGRNWHDSKIRHVPGLLRAAAGAAVIRTDKSVNFTGPSWYPRTEKIVTFETQQGKPNSSVFLRIAPDLQSGSDKLAPVDSGLLSGGEVVIGEIATYKSESSVFFSSSTDALAGSCMPDADAVHDVTCPLPSLSSLAVTPVSSHAVPRFPDQEIESSSELLLDLGEMW